MITFLIFIFILSVLIVVHEFGHLIAAKRVGVRVEKFSLGFGKQLVARKKGDTEYSISAIPLGGFVKLAGDNLEEYKGRPDEYFAKPPGKRFQIIFCGPLLNYILGFLCFWLVFFAGYPTLTTKVGGLIDGFGAKDAGLQVGDKIMAVDGRKVALWEEMQREIQARNDADRVKLLVLRDNKEFTLGVEIRKKQLDDALGQKHSVGLIGITPFDEAIIVRHGFLESFGAAFEKTIDITLMTYKGLWFMLTGRLSMRDSVTGPLGMFFLTSKVARLGITALLNFVGLISVSLALFNLLPFPVLDGGHILFLGIEKLRGRTLGIRAERIITQAGMTVIITLAVFVTYNDILRFFGKWK